MYMLYCTSKRQRKKEEVRQVGARQTRQKSKSSQGGQNRKFLYTHTHTHPYTHTSKSSKQHENMEQQKIQEPVMGIPAYQAPPAPPQMYYQQQQQQPGGGYYVPQNNNNYNNQHPIYNSRFPPNAIFGDPKGVPIHQTIFRDTPAPFHCPHCSNSALTTIRYLFLYLFLFFF